MKPMGAVMSRSKATCPATSSSPSPPIASISCPCPARRSAGRLPPGPGSRRSSAQRAAAGGRCGSSRRATGGLRTAQQGRPGGRRRRRRPHEGARLNGARPGRHDGGGRSPGCAACPSPAPSPDAGHEVTVGRTCLVRRPPSRGPASAPALRRRQPRAISGACSPPCPGSATRRPTGSSCGTCSAVSTPRLPCPACRPSSTRRARDLILREATEFSSCAVAEARAIPYATRRRRAVRVRGDLHAGHGRTAAGARHARRHGRAGVALPGLAAPSVLRGPRCARAAGDEARSGRAGGGAAAEPLVDWWPEAVARDPLVYVTFGSVAASARALPVPLPGRDRRRRRPAGPDPAHDGGRRRYRGPRTAPRQRPRRAVVAAAARHGPRLGHGRDTAASAPPSPAWSPACPWWSCPCSPTGPHNARRVAAVAPGSRWKGGPAAVGELGGAIERVLTGASFRAGAAARVAADIAALPPVAEAVPFLEECAGQ